MTNELAPARTHVILLALRGHRDHQNAVIHIDEKTRNRLGVKAGETVDFTFRQLGCGVSSSGRSAHLHPGYDNF
jgi:phage gp45-like